MLPLLERSIIRLEEGQIDIDHCQVRELNALFGKEMIVFGPGNKNELAFSWRWGAIRAFPLPGSQILPETQIHLLHFVLDQEMALRDLISWYQCQPAYYFVEYPDDLECFAIFSLRMQVKFYPEAAQAKVISFVNQNHVLTCPCSECSVIRQEVKKVRPFTQAPRQLH